MSSQKSLQKIIIPSKTIAMGSVIWLHGLGADGHDFADIVPQLNLPKNLSLRFIFPHAPIRPVTINARMRMRAWYDIYALTDLAKEDESGILETQQSIDALITEEISNNISSNRIVLAGFSQGGAMALLAGLCYHKPLAGIIGLSTYLPLISYVQKNKTSVNRSLPILLAHGRQDSVLPISLGQQAYQFLKKEGHPVEWYEYPMEHQVCLDEITTIGQWLSQRFLQPL